MHPQHTKYKALEVQCKRGLTSHNLLKWMPNPNFYFNEKAALVPTWSLQDLLKRFQGRVNIVSEDEGLKEDPSVVQLLMDRDSCGDLVCYCFQDSGVTRDSVPLCIITEVALHHVLSSGWKVVN